MRVIFFSALLLVSAKLFSQSGVQNYFDSALIQLKSESTIDKTDSTVFLLLQEFYDEVLQSDKGELSEKTQQKFIAFDKNEESKNKYLLTLFLMYQDHIGQAAEEGKQPEVQFQMACINALENEMMNVYNQLPVIISIYKAEALQSAGRFDESKKVVDETLKKVPQSIPLKLYKFLYSGDESMKRDLLANHSGHWMVQQFGIK
jgi:hypothetical protein